MCAGRWNTEYGARADAARSQDWQGKGHPNASEEDNNDQEKGGAVLSTNFDKWTSFAETHEDDYKELSRKREVPDGTYRGMLTAVVVGETENGPKAGLCWMKLAFKLTTKEGSPVSGDATKWLSVPDTDWVSAEGHSFIKMWKGSLASDVVQTMRAIAGSNLPSFPTKMDGVWTFEGAPIESSEYAAKQKLVNNKALALCEDIADNRALASEFVGREVTFKKVTKERDDGRVFTNIYIQPIEALDKEEAPF